MTIGERIRNLRTEKGYTQEYLAAELGISRQAVYKWEKNESRPDTDNLIRLSGILGTSVDYIISGSQNTSKKKPAKPWSYIITIIITAVITFIVTVLFLANAPVSFDAGGCGGGFASAVFDQYSDRLVEENYFYLVREFKNSGIEVADIVPVKGNHEVEYEGKAIYMSFDIMYTFENSATGTARVHFMGERKWIQVYEWKMINEAVKAADIVCRQL